MKTKGLIIGIMSLCLILILSALSIMTGCSSPATTSQPAPSTSSAPAPATTSAPAPSATSPTTGSTQGVVLRLVTMNANTGPSGAITQRFVDMLNQASNGEYTVKLIGGPEIMAAPDIPAAVKNDTFEMGNDLYTLIAPLSSGVYPILDAQINWTQMRANGAADYIQGLFGQAGLHLIVPQDNTGPQNSIMIWSNKKIETLADFKGLKMGNPSPIFLPLWQALGVEQVLIQLNGMYDAMSRGLVDSYGIAESLVPTYKLYEVTKYGLEKPAYASASSCYFMNLDTWNKLSPTAQQNLTNAANNFDAGLVDWFNQNYLNQMIQDIKSHGVQFTSLSDADTNTFLQTFQKVEWADAIKKSPDTATKLQQLLTKQ